VQGFALVKAVGIVIVPCIAAYFVKGPWQAAFGVVPHYWSLKVFWLFDDAKVASALVQSALGLIWQGLLLVLLAQRFARIVRR